MPSSRRIPIATLVACLALAGPAHGQAPPRIDPDSPAGTEYELPLDRARQEAAAGESTGSPRGQAPLFGEGVDATADAETASTRRDAGTGSERAPTGSNDPVPADHVPAKVRAQARAPQGGDGVLTIAVGAGAVLLLGGLAGVLLRRRSASG